MKNKIFKAATLPLSVCMVTAGAACSLEKKIVAAEISREFTRQNSEAVSVTDSFQENMAAFSFSFFQNTLTEKKENNLVSPLSAALCLALINNGADGNTRTQIENAFHMPTDALNRALYAYTSSLYTSKDCKVSLANSIWLKDNALNVKEEFLQANADWYQAQAYVAPFDQTTLQDINNWCYNHTDGKIDKILDSISPFDVMYLINTVDFDAKWEDKYEREDIEKGVFNNVDGSKTDVKMLYSKETRYLLNDDCVGFAKAYKGNAYSFVGLLPNEDIDAYEFAKALTQETWAELWESANTKREDYQHRDVHVRMPEFTYQMELSLNETLQALGITDMFNASAADFSNIDETQPLYCGFVKQKTFIQLDRNGTKAAAVTLGGMEAMSAAPNDPLYITLDRPFVYAIVDNENNLPLFLGLVMHL